MIPALLLFILLPEMVATESTGTVTLVVKLRGVESTRLKDAPPRIALLPPISMLPVDGFCVKVAFPAIPFRKVFTAPPVKAKLELTIILPLTVKGLEPPEPGVPLTRVTRNIGITFAAALGK